MKLLKIKILTLFLFFVPVFKSQAQVSSIKADTVQVVKENKSSGKDKNTQAGSGNGANSQKIKQVKGARPDMSKARGARPPEITRPSGSVVPRGIGKPAGAGRRGGR
jgi:hypothetical protein